jgi:preprotein translocase subunit SecA
MLNLISKLVGSKSDRDLKKLQPYVDAKVNTSTLQIAAMSNDGLSAKHDSFKEANSRGYRFLGGRENCLVRANSMPLRITMHVSRCTRRLKPSTKSA